MDQGNVAFSFFGRSDRFRLSCAREVLYAKDDPKFILMRIYDNSFLKGPYLEWFDESRVGNELGQKAPESLVGPWEYGDAQKRVNVTLTEEGIAKGIIGYSFEDKNEKKQLGSGSIFFTGLWDGNAIHCNMYDARITRYSNKEDISFPLQSFDMVLRDGGFEYDADLMVYLLDGSLVPLKGLCRLKKLQ